MMVHRTVNKQSTLFYNDVKSPKTRKGRYKWYHHLCFIYLFTTITTTTTTITRGIVVHATSTTSTEIMKEEEVEYRYHPSQYVSSYQSLREEVMTTAAAALEQEPDDECINGRNRNNNNNNIHYYSKGRNNNITVAAVQMQSLPSKTHAQGSGGDGSRTNNNDAMNFLYRAEQAVIQAVTEHNATLVLLQELFLGPYFCQSQNAELFALAEKDIAALQEEKEKRNDNENKACGRDNTMVEHPSPKNPIISRLSKLARKYNVILPISIFERKNNAYFNSVVMIDSDGSILGTYRKSHIPDGTGYQEKFYFSPGDTGFKVFHTRMGVVVGVGICWDQWFPEAARSMALMGADLLLYPTAIGTEPQDPTLDSADHWQRTMQGHAAANMVPVVASNRIGTEILLDDNGEEKQRIRFYGRSFITDETGAIVKEAKDGTIMDIITSEIDVEANRATRSAWGLFRDRRPELYHVLKTKDGHLPMNNAS
mmetsp:Transcript_18974/g.26709  ORF Transcript_18974/g.26709 Transcript_18974/m.26709 type:complete len:481 (+) Transcript_18974:133-1575(+)